MVQEGLRLLQGVSRNSTVLLRNCAAAERLARGEPGVPFDADGIIQRGMERLTPTTVTCESPPGT